MKLSVLVKYDYMSASDSCHGVHRHVTARIKLWWLRRFVRVRIWWVLLDRHLIHLYGGMISAPGLRQLLISRSSLELYTGYTFAPQASECTLQNQTYWRYGCRCFLSRLWRLWSGFFSPRIWRSKLCSFLWHSSCQQRRLQLWRCHSVQPLWRLALWAIICSRLSSFFCSASLLSLTFWLNVVWVRSSVSAKLWLVSTSQPARFWGVSRACTLRRLSLFLDVWIINGSVTACSCCSSVWRWSWLWHFISCQLSTCKQLSLYLHLHPCGVHGSGCCKCSQLRLWLSCWHGQCSKLWLSCRQCQCSQLWLWLGCWCCQHACCFCACLWCELSLRAVAETTRWARNWIELLGNATLVSLICTRLLQPGPSTWSMGHTNASPKEQASSQVSLGSLAA